jgi:pyruvate/2-oxoglutarate dehydrogenase complex dihydrolipoamide acyltransferase (E2) component
MASPITIPKLGLTMTDCTLVEWMKQDGDRVAAGEVLFSVETDKMVNEIEAERDGYLRRAAGLDTVHMVGDIVGHLHDSREAALREDPAGRPPAPAAPRGEPIGDGEPTRVVSAVNVLSMQARTGDGARMLVSPVARMIASSHGLDISELEGLGSGPGGAILKRDVERRLEAPKSVAQPAATPLAGATGAEPKRRPLAGMRRTIARRMMESLQGSAQMTAFGRVDMSGSMRLRQALVEREKELRVRVTYTDIVVKAVATVLSQMPLINASIVGDEIVEWPDANVGIAVALEEGLIVPVVHKADRKTLVEIAHERKRLVEAARNGGLDPSDLSGGTFSVSNFGSYGGDFETPILNPPQSAILGIGQIVDEPVVRDGAIVIRPQMMLSMTFDHRLIDGAEAGRFRARLKAYLEEPALQMAVLR